MGSRRVLFGTVTGEQGGAHLRECDLSHLGRVVSAVGPSSWNTNDGGFLSLCCFLGSQESGKCQRGQYEPARWLPLKHLAAVEGKSQEQHFSALW